MIAAMCFACFGERTKHVLESMYSRWDVLPKRSDLFQLRRRYLASAALTAARGLNSRTAKSPKSPRARAECVL